MEAAINRNVLKIKVFLFSFLQLTWGFLQSFLGFIIFCLIPKCCSKFYNGCILTEWKYYFGLSLGFFIFVPNKEICSNYSSFNIAAHEYGHAIQSLILGPFYLLLIGLPSLIWAYLVKSNKVKKPYLEFWIEGNASRIGERATARACKQA